MTQLRRIARSISNKITDVTSTTTKDDVIHGDDDTVTRKTNSPAGVMSHG